MSRGTAFGKHRCCCIIHTLIVRGNLQYPGGLLAAGIDLAKDVASSPEPSRDKVSTDGAVLSMHCQILRGEAVSSA